MKPPDPIRLLTLLQAATYLGLSPWTVKEIIWRGELPRVRISRKILVDRADIDRYIESHKDGLDLAQAVPIPSFPPMTLPTSRKGGKR